MFWKAKSLELDDESLATATGGAGTSYPTIRRVCPCGISFAIRLEPGKKPEECAPAYFKHMHEVHSIVVRL